jgi:hypothetical protein
MFFYHKIGEDSTVACRSSALDLISALRNGVNKLGQQVEVAVSVTPKSKTGEGERAPLPV